MAAATKIGIIGDFNPANATHIATNDCIAHAAGALNTPFESVWLPTDQQHDYSQFNGLFCSPGSPYRSLEGALAGIRFARTQGIPFLGTCGGFQHMILEFARNVLGIEDADHAETNPYASKLFIVPLTCSLVGKTMTVYLQPNTKAAAAYQASESAEAYYCNFGLNPAYCDELTKAGLIVSGLDQDGEIRIMELPSHPFFMGTLFVPQAQSLPQNPHKVTLAFCRAAR